MKNKKSNKSGILGLEEERIALYINGMKEALETSNYKVYQDDPHSLEVQFGGAVFKVTVDRFLVADSRL